MESKKEFKTPSLGYSAFVLAALAISTFVQFKILGASLNVTMFLNWLLMTLLAIPLDSPMMIWKRKHLKTLPGSSQPSSLCMPSVVLQVPGWHPVPFLPLSITAWTL